MSMGFIKDGKYVKTAGYAESDELVIGASTVRKGTFTFVKRSNNQFCDATVTFDTPMPDDDYEVIISWVTIYGISMYGRVQNKTKNGFAFNGYYANENDANSYGNQEVAYTAFKLFTKEGLEDLETEVEEHTTALTKAYAGTDINKSNVSATSSTLISSITAPEKGTYIVSATVYVTHNDAANQHYTYIGIGLDTANSLKGLEQKLVPNTGLWFNVTSIMTLAKGQSACLWLNGNSGVQLYGLTGSFDIIRVNAN